MSKLQIHSPHYLTFEDGQFTVDVLGGVDLSSVERMICTLRISYKNYPPYRTTLDLYNDSQTDKLIRTLCDKWGLKLVDVSKSVHVLIMELESFKLKRLKYPKNSRELAYEPTKEESKQAERYLKDKKLIDRLHKDLESIGIVTEREHALILFLAMASHRYEKPFSVLIMSKGGLGREDTLHKLSGCVPKPYHSYHTHISENALYYFDSYQMDDKVLFIEDLEWTQKMLAPLSALQSMGRLVKTRATKDNDGMLHSTTFEVSAKLCLIANVQVTKGLDPSGLPFLCLHQVQDRKQDERIMVYQKKLRAGLIDPHEVIHIQKKLQHVIATLKPIRIVNPYAPLIEIPEDLPNPRRTLELLLNFIDVTTYFHQFQRARKVDTATGEEYIQSHPDDIAFAFELLSTSLLQGTDDLAKATRTFYNWLTSYLEEAKTEEFTALDIRKAKTIHPRTLNRYLQELTLFHHIQIVGGNKHRGGYIYKLLKLDEDNGVQGRIDSSLNKTLQAIQEEFSRTVGQKASVQLSSPHEQGENQ